MFKINLYSLAVLVLLLVGSIGTQAQQIGLFNNSIVNPFSVNPAKAGENGNQLFLQHRNQWLDMPGAPEYTLLTTEWRLGDSKSALGFNLSYDKDNIIKNTSGYVTYAYHATISKKQKLSFGLSVGIRNNSILFDEIFALEDDDPIIFGYNQTGTKFDGNVGLSYQYDFLTIQFSALQLFGSSASYFNTIEEKEFNYNFARHYVASAAYTFNQVKDFEFTPILQVRGVQGFNVKPEAILKVDYKKTTWAALQYSLNRSVAVTIGYVFQDIFTLGYSAEFSTNNLANYNGATHEILFGIKFGQAFQRNENKREIDAIRKSTNTYDERLEYLKRENDKIRKQVDEQKKLLEDLNKKGNNQNYDHIKKALEDLNKAPKQEEIIKEQKEVQQMMESKAENIQFEQGNTVLKASSFSTLDEMVVLLKEYPKSQIRIEGHTDNTGNAENNLKLSQKRADSVKNYLISKGVHANQIMAIGMGSNEPVVDNKTAEGRIANRRVEIVVSF